MKFLHALVCLIVMLSLLASPVLSATPCSNGCQKEYNECAAGCPKTGFPGCLKMCKVLQRYCGELCYVNQRPIFG